MIENFNLRFCVLVLILQIFTFKPDDDIIILQGIDNAAGWDTSIRVWTKLLHWSGKNSGWKWKLSEEIIFFDDKNNFKILSVHKLSELSKSEMAMKIVIARIWSKVK